MIETHFPSMSEYMETTHPNNNSETNQGNIEQVNLFSENTERKLEFNEAWELSEHQKETLNQTIEVNQVRGYSMEYWTDKLEKATNAEDAYVYTVCEKISDLYHKVLSALSVYSLDYENYNKKIDYDIARLEYDRFVKRLQSKN